MRFQLLLTRHKTPGVILETKREGSGSWVDGEWVEGGFPNRSPLECAIIEMPSRLVYESAGRYTSADKEMYTRSKVPLKSTVEFDEFKYTVEEYVNYIATAQLYQYRLKAVSVHG